MSKAFVRESDEEEDRLEEPQALPVGFKNYMTAQGHRQLQEELHAPINPASGNHGGTHHPSPSHMTSMRLIERLRAHGVEITFEEDRQGGVLNGPRAYFHDPDGTVLEFIDLTSYAGTA